MTLSTRSGGESRRTGRGQRGQAPCSASGPMRRRFARARRFRPRSAGTGGARRAGRRAGRPAARDRAPVCRRSAGSIGCGASGSQRPATRRIASIPKPGSIRSIFITSKRSRWAPSRRGARGADGDRAAPRRRPGRRSGEPAGRQAGLASGSRSAEPSDRPSTCPDRLGGGDRLGEAQGGRGRLLAERSDRTARPARPSAWSSRASRLLPKRRSSGAARHRGEIADRLEPEPAGGDDQVRSRPEARRAEAGRSPRPRRRRGQRIRRREPKRARAWAAPGVPATAIRAAKPKPDAEMRGFARTIAPRRRTDGRPR